MTSPYSLPDYRTRFFVYKTLTKILGEPNVDTIARLQREVKRNAQKVTTTLGGGQNGYLGLVLSAIVYKKVHVHSSDLKIQVLSHRQLEEEPESLEWVRQ